MSIPILTRRPLKPRYQEIEGSYQFKQINHLPDHFMYFIRRTLLVSEYNKIGFNIIALLICSFLKELSFVSQPFYLTSKKSFLNIYFVKIGWAWTLILTIPFVLLSSSVVSNGKINLMIQNIIRLMIATLNWYLMTNLFEQIDIITGRCKSKEFSKKLDCKRNGNEWIDSFDISGHTFLLMYSLLVMSEEAKVFELWENKKYEESIKKFKWFNVFTPFVKILIASMSILTVLWELMLVVTFLYYHEFTHKLLAAFFAISAWYLTYKRWFARKDLFLSPGLPGDF